MATWTYKTVVKSGDRLMADNELNALGKDGWELINVVVVSRMVTEMGKSLQKNFLVYFFKNQAA